ncbi:MAG: co-chaperone GroES [Microgenomates group bacterium]
MAKSSLNIPKLKPMPGYALVEPIELEKKTAAGIVLPDTHDEKSQKGKVIALGGPQITDSGKKIVPEFKVGDTVIYKKWGGDEVKFDYTGKEYVFVKFEDVLAIVA